LSPVSVLEFERANPEEVELISKTINDALRKFITVSKDDIGDISTAITEHVSASLTGRLCRNSAGRGRTKESFNVAMTDGKIGLTIQFTCRVTFLIPDWGWYIVVWRR
jgi:hypothetical protein